MGPAAVLLYVLAALIICCQAAGPVVHLDQIKLKPGFKIALYTSAKIPSARQLTVSGIRYKGATIVYVGSTAVANVPGQPGGKVWAVVDKNSDGTADFACALVDGHHGVEWHAGSLYVAEPSKLSRYDGVDPIAFNGCKVCTDST